MSDSRESGRRRRPWDVVKSLRALEKEIYGIHHELAHEGERARQRVEAVRRLVSKREQVRRGTRKEDPEVRRHEVLGPLLAQIRALQEERGDSRERLMTMATLAQSLKPAVETLAGQYETKFAALSEEARLEGLLSRQHPVAETFRRQWTAPTRVIARFKHLLADLDTLSAEQLYRPVAERLEEARSALVLALHDLGYPQAGIAELVDPDGYAEGKAQATDRIRKELGRVRKSVAATRPEESPAASPANDSAGSSNDESPAGAAGAGMLRLVSLDRKNAK